MTCLVQKYLVIKTENSFCENFLLDKSQLVLVKKYILVKKT